MIETRLLRNAVMLDKHRNFARAAKALNITQPTLSRNIQLLEKKIGERLFDRLPKTILPTQAGEIMLKHARFVISSSRNMQEEIRRHQGLLEGSISIGTGPYPANALLAHTVGLFSKRYPGIDIEISVDDWRKLPYRLMKEDMDFILVETSQLDVSRDYELIHLNRHAGFFFCRYGHPLLKKSNLTAADLSLFPLVFTAFPQRLLNAINSFFFPDRDESAPTRKLQNITCNDLATMKTTISNSESIGIGTYGTLATKLEAGIFVALPFRIPELKTDYDIVKRKALSLSPAASDLIDLLLEFDEEQSRLEIDLIKSLDQK